MLTIGMVLYADYIYYHVIIWCNTAVVAKTILILMAKYMGIELKTFQDITLMAND